MTFRWIRRGLKVAIEVYFEIAQPRDLIAISKKKRLQKERIKKIGKEEETERAVMPASASRTICFGF